MSRVMLFTLLVTILSACVSSPNETITVVTTSMGEDSSQYKVDFRTNQRRYKMGEPILVRFVLTNTDDTPLTLRSSSGSPVVDFVLHRVDPETGDITDEYVWSQIHPDEVHREIVLEPGASYRTEWRFTPTQAGVYKVTASWIDPSTLGEARTRGALPCIFYDIEQDESLCPGP